VSVFFSTNSSDLHFIIIFFINQYNIIFLPDIISVNKKLKLNPWMLYIYVLPVLHYIFIINLIPLRSKADKGIGVYAWQVNKIDFCF